jgi:ABC-type transport system involved in cytochrome bd biosynthesis fused ATPase/permease subunit
VTGLAGERTVLVIAHNRSPADGADRTVWLRYGHVASDVHVAVPAEVAA